VSLLLSWLLCICFRCLFWGVHSPGRRNPENEGSEEVKVLPEFYVMLRYLPSHRTASRIIEFQAIQPQVQVCIGKGHSEKCGSSFVVVSCFVKVFLTCSRLPLGHRSLARRHATPRGECLCLCSSSGLRSKGRAWAWGRAGRRKPMNKTITCDIFLDTLAFQYYRLGHANMPVCNPMPLALCSITPVLLARTCLLFFGRIPKYGFGHETDRQKCYGCKNTG